MLISLTYSQTELLAAMLRGNLADMAQLGIDSPNKAELEELLAIIDLTEQIGH